MTILYRVVWRPKIWACSLGLTKNPYKRRGLWTFGSIYILEHVKSQPKYRKNDATLYHPIFGRFQHAAVFVWWFARPWSIAAEFIAETPFILFSKLCRGKKKSSADFLRTWKQSTHEIQNMVIAI